MGLQQSGPPSMLGPSLGLGSGLLQASREDPVSVAILSVALDPPPAVAQRASHTAGHTGCRAGDGVAARGSGLSRRLQHAAHATQEPRVFKGGPGDLGPRARPWSPS